MDSEMEILSAFVDGEDVDAAALVEALERPDAIEALRDFVKMRAHVRADASTPASAFHESARPASVAGGEGWWRRSVRVRMPLLAAAAVIAVVLAGAPWMLRAPAGEDAPSTTHLAPPTPDRVLHFERGVDWNEAGS